MKNFSDEYRDERMRKSREQVERGGLPVDAEWRLNRLRGQTGDTPATKSPDEDWTHPYQPRTDRVARAAATPKHLFTSNLSASEMGLCASIGITPVGQVMGASTYHVGWQQVLSTYMSMSMELPVLTQAHSEARQLALGRLQREASLLGADGVVGVRLDRRNNEVTPSVIEYVAFGTAVRIAAGHRWNPPFISPVSVQELWALLRAGHFPVGLVYGGCVHYHVASITNRWISGALGGTFGFGSMNNVELTDYTSAVYAARNAAMRRIEAEAVLLQADGIVGVTVEKNIRTHEVEAGENNRRRDLIVHFQVTGAAIMPCAATPYSVDYQMPMS